MICSSLPDHNLATLVTAYFDKQKIYSIEMDAAFFTQQMNRYTHIFKGYFDYRFSTLGCLRGKNQERIVIRYLNVFDDSLVSMHRLIMESWDRFQANENRGDISSRLIQAEFQLQNSRAWLQNILGNRVKLYAAVGDNGANRVNFQKLLSLLNLDNARCREEGLLSINKVAATCLKKGYLQFALMFDNVDSTVSFGTKKFRLPGSFVHLSVKIFSDKITIRTKPYFFSAEDRSEERIDKFYYLFSSSLLKVDYSSDHKRSKTITKDVSLEQTDFEYVLDHQFSDLHTHEPISTVSAAELCDLEKKIRVLSSPSLIKSPQLESVE